MNNNSLVSHNNAVAKENFSKARFKAFFQEIGALLTRKEAALIPFEEIREKLGIKTQSYLGIRQIPIDKIVGSENRYKDFTRTFAPRKNFTEHRWMRIDTAHQEDKILPPVSLYELGGVYFVRDGNHRISVARSRKVAYIDAEVISLDAEIELSPDIKRNEIDQVIIEFEKEKFSKATRIKKIRPEASIELTSIGGYEQLLKNIEEHRNYLVHQEIIKDPEFEDAVRSWYDTVYEPVTALIEKENILSGFKGVTPADLFLWTLNHMKEIEREYAGCVMVEDALHSFRDQKDK
jgi:hypothetical protein